MKKRKDYCTLFPEFWEKTYIGDCCALHDIECGKTGSYSILKSITIFYKCLSTKISIKSAILITTGGTIGYLFKYPKLSYKKFKYKLEKENFEK